MNAAASESVRRKRVFVFCRFYLIDDFRGNFAPLADDYEFAYLTDGHSPGTQDTRERFYRAYRDGDRSPLLTSADVAEIVDRCRYSRAIPRAQAERQVHAMAIAIDEAMASFGPDCVISHMVDDYVTHICSILAAKHGVRFVGYAFSYFPGVVQLTQGWDGTPFDVREPDDAEVTAIYGKIAERVYRQNYLQPAAYSLFRHCKFVLRHLAKYAVFGFRGMWQRDRLNLHYCVTPYVADRKRFGDFPRDTDFSGQWEKALELARAAAPGRPVLYLPLAFTPESTIDYWIGDKRAIDYEAMTVTAAKALAADNILLVKEHLHMQGIRDRRFYAKLRAIDNVVVVPPQAFSNDALLASDAVILGGGSVGIEATIRDKPVLSYAPDCYWFAPSGARELSLGAINSWSAQASAAIAEKVAMPDAAKHSFIAKCLASTVRPRPGNRIWPFIAVDDLRDMLEQA